MVCECLIYPKPGEWKDRVDVNQDRESFASTDIASGTPGYSWDREREKTYHMIETLSEGGDGFSTFGEVLKRDKSRNIYLTPLTSVEVPINMSTKIEELFEKRISCNDSW